MNRRTEMFSPEPQMRSQEELEEAFFLPDASRSLSELEAAHPMGPEAGSLEEQEEDRDKARGIFARLRSHPLTRPLFLTMALLMGGSVAAGSYKSKESAASELVEQAELEDPGVQQELRRLVWAELRESGHALTEAEGRWGRDSWSQGEKLEYGDIPTLEGKFEYLHKDNQDIIAAYRSSQGRLENFGTLFVMMSDEFRHSRLPFDFTDQSINDATELLPDLESTKALELYQSYETALLKFGGLLPVRRLSQQLVETLPAGHPILKHIEQKSWLAAEAADWFKASKENFMMFNQQSGRVEVYHQVGESVVLLEAFPGNGGPANGVAWERGMAAHQAVRTPDGEYTFDQAFEKKSASWQFSWVTDTAPLRWTADKKNVEYQDTDGTWRLLTGEDAEFMVNGASQKPFRDKGKSTLYQWASQKQDDGSWRRPAPFSTADALDATGQLREQWDRNDFGPLSIQMKDHKGQQMSIFFHSNPMDEASNKFLNFSHGCIHMKPADLEIAADYLTKGSRIRISAFESTVAEKEKPGSASQG